MTDQTANTPDPEQPQQPETVAKPAQQQRSPQRPQQARAPQPPQKPQQPQQRQQQQQQQWVDLSVVIPLYNEEESLKELHQQLRATLGRMGVRYELIFVDDGSTDRSFQVLRDLKRNDRHIKVIRFRRNYGKSAALSVGFDKAQGNVVITMDADLQDDPAEIPSLKRKLDEGYDLVSGWKKIRRDPLSKKIPSKIANFVTSRMTGVRIHDMNCGLKAYKRDVVKTVRVYGELHRYIPALARFEGFKIGEMVVQHRARRYGKTKFGIGRFWKGFLDLLTVLFTTRYFRNPLHLFGLWGFFSVLVGTVISAWLVVERLMGETALSNRPLFLVGVMLIIVGIQFFSIGLLGEMITKTRKAEEEYSIRDYLK